MTPVFVVPFILYLLGTQLVGRLNDANYPVGYAVLVVVIAVVTTWLIFRGKRTKPELLPRMHWRVWPGVLVGGVGITAWIGLCHLHLEQYATQLLPKFLQPGERVGYNPFEEIQNPAWCWTFIAFRLVGIAAIVPVAEEFFWRGFLLRWLIDPEWERVPLGEFTVSSCLMVTAMFTLAHPEWIAAAVYCLLINGLLYWRRDLWQCIVAHAVSNLVLAIYVLNYEHWWLW